MASCHICMQAHTQWAHHPHRHMHAHAHTHRVIVQAYTARIRIPRRPPPFPPHHSSHQVVYKRAVLEKPLVHEAVEMGGDQDVGAVLLLGNPVPQGGCEQRQSIILCVGGGGREREGRGERRQGERKAIESHAVAFMRHTYMGSTAHCTRPQSTHCCCALAKLVQYDQRPTDAQPHSS